MKISPIIYICFLTLYSCSNPQEPEEPEDFKPTIKQGIWGKVLFWEGDFAPTVDPPSPRGKIFGVQRLIAIHPPTLRSDVYLNGIDAPISTLYDSIGTTALFVTLSNDEGFFEISIDTGYYSLFVREGDLWYANRSSGGGILQGVYVLEDSSIRYDIDITYEATF